MDWTQNHHYTKFNANINTQQLITFNATQLYLLEFISRMKSLTKLFLEGRIFIYLNVTSVWKYRLTHFHTILLQLIQDSTLDMSYNI